MATAAQSLSSVELFYSYAHSDELLCRELQKHLTALKRAGLIRDWYDRKIEPGSEWDAQIHAALERAGIILLLLSADFLNSKYIFEVEVPFALERHRIGRAKVIPVLLRPVEWRDSPFAQLQMLPSEARAITLWPNRDEAFSDVAGRLRELLYNQRWQELTPPAAPIFDTSLTAERVLDAAISSSVVLDEPADLVILVRPVESGGLKQILLTDRTHSPIADDVRSTTFELEFPVQPSGKVMPAALELQLESPDFDPPSQQKKLRVPPKGDSGVSVFMLTPKRAGTLRLNLQLIADGVEIGSRALVTVAVPEALAQPKASYDVVSQPLKSRGALPRGPEMLAPYSTTSAASGYTSAATGYFPMPPPRAARPEKATRMSRHSAWIGVASSAAAIALVATTITWNSRNTSVPTPDSVSAPSKVVALNRAIEQNPAAANLYLERAKEYEKAGKINQALTDAEHATKLAPGDAQTHLSYAQLLEKAHLDNQALQAYQKVQDLQPTPQVQEAAAKRSTALRRQVADPARKLHNAPAGVKQVH